MTQSTEIEAVSSDFEIADIFISRTDKRGVIQAANETFPRVSGYDWDKLRNAPHKLVRHEDMPKAVFWKFWDVLQNDQPIGAFVKNKRKCGTAYWVFATVIPLEDGYLSVRIKPAGPSFKSIINEYEKLLLQERSDGLTPEQSYEVLEKRLKDLGFSTYEKFMAAMLVEQIDARNKLLERPAIKSLSNLTKVSKAWENVEIEAQKTYRSYERITGTPINMRIQAAQLSREGVPLSIIAANFSMLANQIKELMDEFMKAGNKVEHIIQETIFFIGFKHNQGEVVELYRNETADMEGIDKDNEILVMETQNQAYSAKASISLSDLLLGIGEFMDMCDEVRLVLSGLSITRVMADIETAQITKLGESSIKSIIDELSHFQEDAGACLTRMKRELKKIQLEIKRALENENPNFGRNLLLDEKRREIAAKATKQATEAAS